MGAQGEDFWNVSITRGAKEKFRPIRWRGETALRMSFAVAALLAAGTFVLNLNSSTADDEDETVAATLPECCRQKAKDMRLLDEHY